MVAQKSLGGATLMTAGETATLWQKLTAAGLAQGTLPPPTPPGQAWYIRAMLVLSGWLAAVFLLLFLGFLSVAIFDKPAVALVLGICIFAGAYAMMRHAGQGDFLQQLSLATALAGKVLFLYGLARLIQGNITAFWIQMAAVEIILIVALPSYIHRVVCTLGAATAVSGLLFEMHALPLSTALASLLFVFLWLGERRWAGRESALAPVAIGMALVLTLWDAPALMKSGETVKLLAPGQNLTRHVALILEAAAWLGLTGGMLQRAGIAPASTAGITVLITAAAAAAFAWWAPGLLPALMVLVVGFGSGQRFLLGLGLLSLAAFLSGYYYNLEATLLVKSIVLGVSGGVMLLLRFALGRSGGTPHA
ncbi:MAG: DUF4401 domain-containing protein [Turneriella sp.]|nr:DUF4401 domain-containing protein [Turneriella sp.]